MVTNFSIHEKLKIKHVHDTAIIDDVRGRIMICNKGSVRSHHA
jgi:hypothetical protein